MHTVSLALAAITAAFAQTSSPHYTPGKMALDLNVECVSLLGTNLYRTPELGGADVKALERHLAETQKFSGAQPENPATHMEHGRALEALWRFHDAAQAYTKAIALNPADGSAYTARGETFLVLRLFTQARADFQHATSIAPAAYDAWYGLGLAHWFGGEFAKSAEAFARAFNLGSDQQQVADAGELNNIAAARAGNDALQVVLGGDPAKRADDDPFTRYLQSLNVRVNDEAGAMTEWRALAASKDWPNLGVIAAEAEIARIEGSKKMVSAR